MACAGSAVAAPKTEQTKQATVRLVDHVRENRELLSAALEQADALLKAHRDLRVANSRIKELEKELRYHDRHPPRQEAYASFLKEFRDAGHRSRAASRDRLDVEVEAMALNLRRDESADAKDSQFVRICLVAVAAFMAAFVLARVL